MPDVIRSNVRRVVLRLLAATVVPFIVLGVYLQFFPNEQGPLDDAALLGGLATGLLFVVTMPTQLHLRLLLAVAYAVVATLELVIVWVMYACSRFGDCL